MCGPQSPRPQQSLGGALAVLSSPCSSASSQSPFHGHLVFHTMTDTTSTSGNSSSSRSSSSSIATHATFTSLASSSHQPEEQEWGIQRDLLSLDDYMVGIHATGDLRTSGAEDQWAESMLLHSFDFRRARPSLVRGRSTEVLLDAPLEIGVGGDGIIGRKVSIWRRSADGEAGVRVAEGIVGFN